MDQLTFVVPVEIRAIVTEQFKAEWAAGAAAGLEAMERERDRLVTVRNRMVLRNTDPGHVAQVEAAIQGKNEQRKQLGEKAEAVATMGLGDEVGIGVQQALVTVNVGEEMRLLGQMVAVVRDGVLIGLAPAGEAGGVVGAEAEGKLELVEG